MHAAEQSRVFIVRDVNRRDADQLAAAYRELFLASGGGALGLFTAVRALRAVESRISAPLFAFWEPHTYTDPDVSGYTRKAAAVVADAVTILSSGWNDSSSASSSVNATSIEQ